MFGREPVVWIEFVRALIAVVVAFGWDLTGEQVAGIILLTGALLAVVTRQSVTPNQTVRDAMGSAPAARALERKIGALVIVSIVALGSTACALVPKGSPTPDSEQARLVALDRAVTQATATIKTARAAQGLTIALGDTMPPAVALRIAMGMKTFFVAADGALAVAEDTAKPLATRTEALQALVREGRALLAALDIGPAVLRDSRDAISANLALTEAAVIP